MDPVYGFQAVNVEAQLRNPSSFLHWLRRMLAGAPRAPGARHRRPRGAVDREPVGARLLAPLHRRRRHEDIVLCVNNLSRFAQPVELMIPQLAGKVPVELLGRVPFPPIGELPYFVTLPPYGFYWFTLHEAGARPMIEPGDLATLLPDFLVRQRWYGASDLELAGVEVSAFEVWQEEWPSLIWVLADARFADDSVARFQVPVGLRPLDQTERFLEGKGRSMLGDVDTPDGPALVYDALVDPELALAFLRQIAPDEPVERVRSLNVEQSNTSVVYDERLIMKLFRRLAEGPNPDVEVTEALARVGFTHISAPVATWRRDGIDLAVVRTFLEAGTEGWQLALTSLRDVYGSRLDPRSRAATSRPRRAGSDRSPRRCT